MDWQNILQVTVNFVGIVAFLWVVFAGGKTIWDLWPALKKIKGPNRSIRPSFTVISSMITNTLLIVVIVILFVSPYRPTYFRTDASTPLPGTKNSAVTQTPSSVTNPSATSQAGGKIIYQADWSNGKLNGWSSHSPIWSVNQTYHLINYQIDPTYGATTIDDSSITAPQINLPTSYEVYTEIQSYYVDSFYHYQQSFGIFIGSPSGIPGQGYTCLLSGKAVNSSDQVTASFIPPAPSPTASTTFASDSLEFTITIVVKGNRMEAFVGQNSSPVCVGNISSQGNIIGILTHQLVAEVDAFTITEIN